MVVLHECAGDPELGEGRHRIDLGEPTTGIAKTLWADELDKVRHKDTYTEVTKDREANYLADGPLMACDHSHAIN